MILLLYRKVFLDVFMLHFPDEIVYRILFELFSIKVQKTLFGLILIEIRFEKFLDIFLLDICLNIGLLI